MDSDLIDLIIAFSIIAAIFFVFSVSVNYLIQYYIDYFAERMRTGKTRDDDQQK